VTARVCKAASNSGARLQHPDPGTERIECTASLTSRSASAWTVSIHSVRDTSQRSVLREDLPEDSAGGCLPNLRTIESPPLGALERVRRPSMPSAW
jgi:hypothetical protein